MIQHIIENKIVYLLGTFLLDGSIYRWMATTIFCLFFSIRKDRDVTKNTPFFLPPPITFSTHRPNFKRVLLFEFERNTIFAPKIECVLKPKLVIFFSTHRFYVFAPNKYSMRHMEFMRTVMSRLVISESYFSPSFHTDGALSTCDGKYRNAGSCVGFHFFAILAVKTSISWPNMYINK